ncbi:MAG TPA: hypothetical protein VIY48_16625, partial [Candidatus Paceibacterota bacterium]
ASGELRYFYRLSGDDKEREAPNGNPIWDDIDQEYVLPRSRTFIPALLADNPYLGDDYLSTLQLMPEPLRSALKNGSWAAMITDDAYQVIPSAWIKAAMDRWRPTGMMVEGKLVPKQKELTTLGADVARGGQDYTALCPRYGAWFGKLETHPGSATRTGGAVVTHMLPYMQVGEDPLTKEPVYDGMANIDVIGIGASVYDNATDNGMPATPVNFAEGSDYTDRSGRLKFVNKRAEGYWRLREALSPELPVSEWIALPPDTELYGDLSAPRWVMTVRGVKIEEKEDIHKRLGRSPDKGDAVVLANMEGVNPLSLIAFS